MQLNPNICFFWYYLNRCIIDNWGLNFMNLFDEIGLMSSHNLEL
jgi:hypothetical protein